MKELAGVHTTISVSSPFARCFLEMNMADPLEHDIDRRLTTLEGARREQLRRWAALPLEDTKPSAIS
jgi:hypothetical protein